VKQLQSDPTDLLFFHLDEESGEICDFENESVSGNENGNENENDDDVIHLIYDDDVYHDVNVLIYDYVMNDALEKMWYFFSW
jgi:hypothetical protein